MKIFVDTITRINHALGQLAAWLGLALVFLQVVIVLNRYCFGYSALFGVNMINFEEALLYLFSAIFLFGAAQTYTENGHVRVDIFYATMRPRRQHVVDLVGNLALLLPLVLLLLIKSNASISQSWSNAEGSVDGGLPYVYLWRTMLPVFALSLALQAVANVVDLILRLTDHTPHVERLLAGGVALLSALCLWVALGWTTSPDWAKPDPAWRFDIYALGVWLARCAALCTLLWCAATIFGHVPRITSKEG